MTDLSLLSITTAHKQLLAREISARELAEASLASIDKKNKELNAFLEVYDDVLLEADRADSMIRSKAGEISPLTGIPIALKDNILVKGKRVTAASKILEKYVATYDATIVTKLKAVGAVLVGRTNMDEFAMGASTENSAYGVVHNPHDQTRVPGGSSGGSAAALAAGMVLGAYGSDTGGSIRQPAAFCGVVGFKPTYGSVSRSGLIAMGSSLDQIGPFGKSIEDTEILFNAIRGRDRLDSTSIDSDTYAKKPVPSSFTIGVPRHFMEKGVDKDVMELFDQSLKKLEAQGHRVVEVSLPNIQYSLAVYYILMPAEASTNLARFDGMRFGSRKEAGTLLDEYLQTRGEGFGPEPSRRIVLGAYVLSSGYYDAYYGKANAVRRLVGRDFANAFQKVDVIATPTTPTPAFKIGEKSDPLSMYLADVFTVPANITGIPAISLPIGTVTRDGTALPVGMQCNAPLGNDELLFRIGEKVLA